MLLWWGAWPRHSGSTTMVNYSQWQQIVIAATVIQLMAYSTLATGFLAPECPCRSTSDSVIKKSNEIKIVSHEITSFIVGVVLPLADWVTVIKLILRAFPDFLAPISCTVYHICIHYRTQNAVLLHSTCMHIPQKLRDMGLLHRAN